jgi:hypothetical protein
LNAKSASAEDGDDTTAFDTAPETVALPSSSTQDEQLAPEESSFEPQNVNDDSDEENDDEDHESHDVLPEDYAESKEDESSNDEESMDQHVMAHDIADVITSDHEQPTDGSADSIPIENKQNIIQTQDEAIVMEISSTSSSQQPTCDLLPLAGGRYFWRNRQRLVDRDKTKICGPKVLIIGAKKCGTTNIADMLMRHPRVKVNSCNLKNTMGGCREGWFQGALKQGIMFNGDDFTHKRRYLPNGWLDEFGKRLPSTDGVHTMTIDKSPSYMDISFFPDVAEYAKAHLPNAKIVATLCNPAERLYSEWKSLPFETHDGYKQLYRDNDVEPPADFASFVNYFRDDSVCKEKEGFCETHRKQYLKQGDFLQNLQPWYDIFGKENVLVVNMDERPANIVKDLLQHVGHDLLPESEYPWDQVAQPYATNVNEEYEGRGSSYLHFDDAMTWLERYYSPQNEELAKDMRADWPMRWNCRLNGNCDQYSWPDIVTK